MTEPDNIPSEPPVDDEAFDLAVRDTAYFMWVQDGRPEGRADEYWYRALEQHLRARAYSIWLRNGDPKDGE